MGTKVGSNEGRRAILVFCNRGSSGGCVSGYSNLSYTKTKPRYPVGTVLVAVTNIGQGSQVTC